MHNSTLFRKQRQNGDEAIVYDLEWGTIKPKCLQRGITQKKFIPSAEP